MHLQVLSSGSRGNATLVRAGELRLLVDAGLTLRELDRRLEAARVPARGIHHVAVTHGHLDHARSGGALAKRFGIPLTCSEKLMRNASIRRAPELRSITFGRPHAIEGPGAGSTLQATPVQIPHDADPTVAWRLEHEERVAVILTDMGRPSARVARALAGAHVLVLEFNHDPDMLAGGPYPHRLKRRIAGDGGHLSNAQAAEMLGLLAGPELHTLVLAHLSETNNRPELALAAARAALEAAGRPDVVVHVAEQDAVGPNLEV